MHKFLLACCYYSSPFVFSQYGYVPQHDDGIEEFGGWDKSASEFNRAEIDRVDINFLKETFLNNRNYPCFL